MIKLCIFDMAGTIIDEDNIVYHTIHDTLKAHGYNVDIETVLDIGAGKEKRDAIEKLLLNKGITVNDQILDTLHSAFLINLKKQYNVLDFRLFPEVRPLIKQLKSSGIKIAFNTGYDRYTAEMILQRTDLKIGKDFDQLVTASDVTRPRPYPDMILTICKNLEIDPSESLKVGDSCTDIEEGRNAKVLYSLGITTGAQTKDQLLKAEPDGVLDNLLEILSYCNK